MDQPEFVLSPETGEPSRVTLFPRIKPWHIRIGDFDLYVVVGEGEVEDPGPELQR